MQILYNDKTDLLYIRLDERKQEVINKRGSENIVLDIGEGDRIVGIEILDASKHLNLEQLLPLRKSDELLEKLQIRKWLKKEKLYCYFPKMFEELFALLSIPESEKFWFALSRHTSMRTFQDYSGNKATIRIKDWWSDPNIWNNMLIQEIFDDYWASFLCFHHGFTKQALAILRNTLELIIIICFIKFCKKEDDKTIIKWIKGESGFREVSDKIDAIKRIEFLKAEGISSCLGSLYDTLCSATHSHKKMMTSLTVPGGFLGVRDKMMFEPFIIIQTRSIFIFVIEIELKMLKHFIEQDGKTPFTEKILSVISKMETHLKKYSLILKSIKKGYVVHRKPVNLDSGKSILFSLKINNVREFKGNPLLSKEEEKDLEEKIDEILLCDTL